MSASKRTDQELVAIYNEIDSWLRQQYRSDKYADHGVLIQEIARSNNVVARHQQELRSMAYLRNNLVHNPMSKIAHPIAMPNPKIVARYEAIKEVLIHPTTALSIAIPAHKIYTATLETNLNRVIKDMNKNIYTHVPIIQNNKMIGVFSENSLLSFLADVEEAIITKEMKINDLADYLPLKAHTGECFEFLPRKASFAEVLEIFNRAIRDKKRIGMLFITEHGYASERPLGIITAWDLASPEFELR